MSEKLEFNPIQNRFKKCFRIFTKKICNKLFTRERGDTFGKCTISYHAFLKRANGFPRCFSNRFTCKELELLTFNSSAFAKGNNVICVAKLFK